MRAIRTLALMFLVPCLFASPVWGEEDTPKPPSTDGETKAEPKAKPKPDPELAQYSVEYLMPNEDAEIEGWKVRDSGAPAGSPTEDDISAISEACGCGLDDDSFYVQTGVLKGKDGKVGYAMCDVDKSVWAFREKLQAKATAAGWKILELGSPGRLLVVGAGSNQAEAHAALREHVVYALGGLAMGRLRGGSGMEAEGRAAAIAYSKSIGAMAPKTGIAHGIVGVVHWIKARPKKRGEKPDPVEEGLCAAAWKKALAEGIAFPLRKGMLVFCAGEYGQILLTTKKKEVLAEATRVLKTAVKHEKEGNNEFRRFGNRYNLACCYARAGKIDEAIAGVEAALKTGKSMPDSMFRPQYVNIKDKDPDMAPLRDDPRFSKLMADFKPKPLPAKKNPHGKK